jgi:hypothetical protein
MIELEFKVNEEQISKKFLKDIEKADEIGLQCCGFLMPVKFIVDGKDVFYDRGRKNKKDEWYDMPLIDFSTSLLGKILTLPTKKKNKFIFTHEGYSDILFEMLPNNKVRLIYTGTMQEFIIDYDELLKAFKKFEKEVKEFLNESVPQLREHPYWGSWLKGDTEWESGKGLIPIKKKIKKN